MKTLVSETIPKFNKFFEMRLCSNEGGDGFFVGKEVGVISMSQSTSQKMWTQTSLFLMEQFYQGSECFCLGT